MPPVDIFVSDGTPVAARLAAGCVVEVPPPRARAPAIRPFQLAAVVLAMHAMCHTVAGSAAC